MKVWRSAAAGLAWLFLACAATTAYAQTLPSEPIEFGAGHVTVGGDVSGTFSCATPIDASCGDDIGFFNYTDYAHKALRLFRVDVSAAVKAGPHFTVLSEVRSENISTVQPYALYLRVRPWSSKDFDIQVGRVPPTFGAFLRHSYANDNPLIGYPLAYQYLTTLRPDALPVSADELLRKKSTGWLVRYSVGDPSPQAGVPLVTAFRWDTGVQAHGTVGIVSATAAITTGTVSNPLFKEDNGGRQLATRVELRPVMGLVIGTSFAHGAFVSQAAARDAVGTEANEHSYAQTAWGGDVEYSHGYYLLRAETIVSAWRLPAVATPPPPQVSIDDPLAAFSTSIEGRYKVLPRLYVAARFDRLMFSDLADATGVSQPWDAPVRRIEVGTGYSLQRNLVLKLSYQYNTRDGGVIPTKKAKFGAAQLVYWF
jgi:hypothetical protein